MRLSVVSLCRMAVAACALGLFATGHAEPASSHHPVLMISIDGQRPADIIDAPTRGLKVPNLRRFLSEGEYASGVRGILPTVTYPAHTTLLTGALPAEHGIVSNTTFDPFQTNAEGWDWYATDVKLPTLWQAAHAAGMTTGNVHWPVSVGASGIDWNLPQIWRSGSADDAKLLAALATPGLLAELEASEGVYAAGIDESIDADEVRGRFAARLIARHHPDFMTVYLTALDHSQHVDGPDTPQAHAVLERIDAVVGRVIAAEKAAHPDATVVVVSDHGFAPVDKALNLFRAFLDAGLIRGADAGAVKGGWKVADWDAMPWPSGGSYAVVLARPGDAALRQRVTSLLDKLKADPAAGVAAVIGREAIASAGGNPQADFYINLADHFMALPWRGPDLPLVVSPPPYKGMHGYFAQDPRMLATFMMVGPGVPPGRNLGEIDMRSIAPTLAAILGVRLDHAMLPPLAAGLAVPAR